MAKQIGALVLAGGNAQRLNGQNKALLTLEERSFLARLSDAFAGFDELLLACGANEIPPIGRFVAVPDRLSECGPLAGIAAALATCKSDALVVVACDMPLFSAELADFLAASLGTHPAVACRDRAGWLHPLCGVYTKACLPALNAALDAGRLRMSSLFEEISGRSISLENTPFSDALLTNINTPDELERLSDMPNPMKGDREKKAILVVSFGTSYQATRDATIGAIEQEIAVNFPAYEIRRAFTSQMVMNKLKKRDNLVVDNVSEAMERLVADGFGTVIVQPTHVMNGFEYDDAVRVASRYAAHFSHFHIGCPLLTSTADYQRLARVIADEYRPAHDTALVLMGHGSAHFANATYAALAYHFLAAGHHNILVGAVEGYPELEDVLAGVQALGVRKVTLAPLMVVAGDHATNDMAGDRKDSWNTAFQSAGFEVTCIIKGMGEYKSIRDIYVSHVHAAIARA